MQHRGALLAATSVPSTAYWKDGLRIYGLVIDRERAFGSPNGRIV